ncbi:MBL fold metallo-hydrolase RNA specificity domain-containing protein [Vibrio viridaestus]|uniref:MBL fold metallo-hydrolase n=1 Tax=Vibrio viridaestus TaxID=2487322 RepID=A0A3N9TC20_9VIBR|nr:MBL fold metallo-hydrolase [Vibrio viridaestus]RQW61701.1 MBL fold metallo-hydrolase [Vibrio viridaestus]
MLNLIHHGAKNGVTGSCHELKFIRSSILFDCGLFQGNDYRSPEIDFSLSAIEAVILSHAHSDHIGRLPWLLAKGYTGKIYCTPATAVILPLVLRDSLHLTLGLASSQIQVIIERLNKQIITVHFGQWNRLRLNKDKTYCYLRFSPAGHILGSAITEIKLSDGQVIVFTGDLGPSNTPLLPDPIPPKRADYLIMESTYGDKHHETISQRTSRLEEIIHRSLNDGGTIIIPAFSIGRTQELLYDIESLLFQHEISDKLPIIVDSPMAIDITRAYRQFRKLWGQEAQKKVSFNRHPLAFEQCITVGSFKEHQRIVNRLAHAGEPAIVIAASGMCQGGRVMDYLAKLLPDEKTDVLMVGYQAEGTLGRELQSGYSQVQIDGSIIDVRAKIRTISGYSAHADQEDLIRFVTNISEKPKHIRLVHGDIAAQNALKEKLTALEYDVSDSYAAKTDATLF